MKLTSAGYQYKKMPNVVGLYKKYIDRAETEIQTNGTSIESVDILYGGARYTNPSAVFIDRTNNGSGAEAKVIVVDGSITEINVTKPGTGYVEPVLILVETDGKYISLTNEIGKLNSVEVVKPGRAISADRSLKPELLITTRVILRNPTGSWVYGSEVYQGLEDYKLVTAKVFGYDEKTQILTLIDVDGRVKDGEVNR